MCQLTCTLYLVPFPRYGGLLVQFSPIAKFGLGKERHPLSHGAESILTSWTV